MWDVEDPRIFYDFGCRKPDHCTCIVCHKQPPTLKAAASKIVFRFLYNIDKFCFDPDTTYDQYVYAVHCGLPIEQLVPFTQFPVTLTLQFIQFDDLSLGQYHKNCVSAVDAHNGGRWESTLQRQFESGTEFVNLVLRFRMRCWCAHCERSLFLLPQRVPCQRLFN
jgi:hypothetical protein